MRLPGLAEIEAAVEVVRPVVPPTPQYAWPLLAERAGREIWVKHENHTPIGAFKLRGGLVYMRRLRQSRPDVQGVISATRGNHGQSMALAARREGLHAVVVVPQGNNPEKNAAMRAFGAELIEHGRDFQSAAEFAFGLAEERGLHFVPPFHPWLIEGVATYALEFFRAAPALDTVYVPIGMGSGICSVIAARDALGLGTRVVGVVAKQAAAYALSFRAGEVVATDSADTIADGLACRQPSPEALAVIRAGAADVMTVSEDEIRAAMRHAFTDTHNVIEGAAAAALAAALRHGAKGERLGVIFSGGNADRRLFARVLSD